MRKKLWFKTAFPSRRPSSRQEVMVRPAAAHDEASSPTLPCALLYVCRGFCSCSIWRRGWTRC
jgi:hypothetical protein